MYPRPWQHVTSGVRQGLSAIGNFFPVSDTHSPLFRSQSPLGTRKFRPTRRRHSEGHDSTSTSTDSQLGHVSPGLSLLVSVCVLMLPVLGLVDEHVQLTTTYHTSPINHFHVHMTFSHTLLVLPSLNNIIPAMIFQKRGVKLNIGCPSYISS